MGLALIRIMRAGGVFSGKGHVHGEAPGYERVSTVDNFCIILHLQVYVQVTSVNQCGCIRARGEPCRQRT
jgi:hypothetical protein